MGLIQKFRNIIRSKRILKLDTLMPEISIDILERFLHGEKRVIDNAMVYDAKKYRKAMHLYVAFLQSKHIQLTDRELKSAKAITGINYSMDNGDDRGEYVAVIQLIRTHNLDKIMNGAKEYSTDKRYYNEIDISNIKENVLSIFRQFNSQTMNGIKLGEKEQQEILSITKELEEREFKNKYIMVEIRDKLPENAKINPNFERLIKSKIRRKPFESKEELAFRIYNVLNENVEFEPGYFIGNHDELSADFINRINNRGIEEVTEKNNRVICKQWSGLYAYFLREYGIDSNIVKLGYGVNNDGSKTGHTFVEVITDTGIIKADATQGKESIIDRSNMPDLSRAKLGISPVGFEGKETIKRLLKDYAKGVGYSSQQSYPFRKNVHVLMDLIKQDKSFRFLTQEERIQRGIEFIREQVEETKLKGMPLVDYIKHVFPVLVYVNQKNKEDIGLSTSLYGREENNQIEYKPVIYHKGEDGNYKYYIISSGKTIEMTAEELERQIKEGRINIVPGKERHIPGIDQELKASHLEETR